MLSIAPGGGLLETAPFKLTTEMIKVLGGDVLSPSYNLFSQLCIKAYLACRLYADEIIQIVSIMIESELPCFRG
jgi:phosphatidylinositol kinase/protein kinase (PI-3  family)